MQKRPPLTLGLLLLAAAYAHGEGETLPSPEGDQHHVFVGLNLTVRLEEKHLPVQRVVGGYVFVLENGNVRPVPYHQAVAYRMETDVKVSDVLTTISGLKAERAYTPAADPRRKWFNSVVDVKMNQDMIRAEAEQKVIRTAMSMAATGVGGMGQPDPYPKLDAALAEMDKAFTTVPGGDTDYYMAEMYGELADELFDAIDLTFQVSAPFKAAEPYFVVIADFLDPQKPGQTFHWIYAQALDELSPVPRKVKVFKGGFPPGFTLQTYRVHLYSGTRELATNASEKHMVLSTDDAHLYLRAGYESDNRGKSLPPKPLWTTIPAAQREQIPPNDLRRVLLLVIDQNGRVTDVRAEDNEFGPLSPEAVTAIKRFRFYPALQSGKPVDDNLRVRFAELSRRSPNIID